MPIHFNSPEHIKERQQVKPLTLEEMENLIEDITDAIEGSIPSWRTNQILLPFQRMVYEYENYKHAYISSRNVTEDIEVIYTVESKNKENE